MLQSLLILVAGYWMLDGCTTKKNVNENRIDEALIKYAKGFTVQEFGDQNKLVEVGHPYQ